MGHISGAAALLLCAAVLVLPPAVCHTEVQPEHGKQKPYAPSLPEFFASVDTDGDGQLEQQEVSTYVGTLVGSQTQQQIDQATEQVLRTLDGLDSGATVSVAELDRHLHLVLSGVRVHDWMRYGLGLGQYADAFKKHAITPLDFPMLVHNGGALLESELEITNLFHKAKVMRAIRLQILGLGKPPSEPQALGCNCLDERVALWWSEPADLGQPPLHKYVLERQATDGAWHVLLDTDDATLYTDNTVPAQGYAAGGGFLGQLPGRAGNGAVAVYRLAAWNLYGRSSYATVMCECGPLLAGGSCAAPDPGSNLTVVAPQTTSSSMAAAAGGVGTLAAADSGKGGSRREAPASLLWSWSAQLNGIVLLLLPLLLRMLPGGLLERLHVFLANLRGKFSSQQLAPSDRSQQRLLLTPEEHILLHHHRSTALADHAHLLVDSLNWGSPLAAARKDSALHHGEQTQLATPFGSDAAAAVFGDQRSSQAHRRQPSQTEVLPPRPPCVPDNMRLHPPCASMGNLCQTDPSVGRRGLLKSGSEGDLPAASSPRTISGPPGTHVPTAGQSPPRATYGMDGAFGGSSSTRHAQSQELDAAVMAGWRPSSRGKACAFPGCGRKLDIISNFRDYQRRHYCGHCQDVFCLEHTAYSPHGPTGSCGHESRCVCYTCIKSFRPEYQLFLEQRNTLRPAANGASESHASGRMLWQRAVCKLKAVVRLKHGAHHAPE